MNALFFIVPLLLIGAGFLIWQRRHKSTAAKPTAVPPQTAVHPTADPAAQPTKPTPAPTAPPAETPPGWPKRGVVLHGTGIQPATPADVQTLYGLGARHFRIYLTLDRWGKDYAGAWAAATAWADGLLDTVKTLAGADATVHMTAFWNATTLAWYDVHSAPFWANGVPQIYAQTQALAQHFATRGAELLAYDVISEPTLIPAGGKGQQPPGWPSIQNQVIQVLRTADAHRWVLVKPGPWCAEQGYANFSLPPFDRLIAQIHFYAPHPYTHQGVKGLAQPVAYPGAPNGKQVAAFSAWLDAHPGVPAMVGEFSAATWAPGGDDWVRTRAAAWNARRWSWCYHSLGGSGVWDPRHDSTFGDKGLAGQTTSRWATLAAILGGS